MDALDEYFITGNTTILDTKTPYKNVAGMKPGTSKTSSSSQSPPPEEPMGTYVNDNLPDPDDEPTVSDMSGFQQGEEMHRQKSELARANYEKARPEMIADQRAVTAQLFYRYTEDEERKRLEQQKNKDAMSASVPPSSRSGQGDNRKRRNEAAHSAEEEWKRQQQQQQQHWINQNSMQHGFQMQHQQYHQHQQFMMQQQHMAAQQHHGMQMHHSGQMPSTSSADSVRSVPTPASMHQPSPAEMRNGSGMSTSRSAMDVSSPMNVPDNQSDENTLTVPEGEWFDKLAVIVAEQYNADTVLGPDTYDELLKFTDNPVQPTQLPNGVVHDRIPSAPQHPTPQQQQDHQLQQNKMRLLQQQQQQQHQEMQRMEQQRQQQMMQAQSQQQRQQLLFQQQQMQSQHQMNGGFPAQSQQAAQQHAAYMQMQRMQHMRLQQQQQQQQQHQQHQLQNGAMAYGMPNGYPPQMHMHHPPAYGHHMPQHTPFANIN